jgi:superfamily II RNA helicase
VKVTVDKKVLVMVTKIVRTMIYIQIVQGDTGLDIVEEVEAVTA